MITFALQKFHIMAEKERYDTERMIMRAQYAMSLIEDSWRGGNLSDMEREDFKSQIAELLQGMTTLLDSNTRLGQELADAKKDLDAARDDLSKANKKIGVLESEIKYLKGKQNASNRHRYGDNGEKNINGTSKSKGRTKDEDENDYIENEGRNVTPATEGDSSSSETSNTESPKAPVEKSPRDTSNRPDHYNTMHADVYVEHDCDLDALKAMGLTFIRYSRPIDQFDRISVIRQDRYKTAWVRDKDGKEFDVFDLIKLLYKVELENIFFHRTEQEVVKARKQEAIPILSQLLQKATELLKMSDSKQVTISEKLHQALKYMINNWQELYGYVNIGNVLIDNNCCERAVRPFTNLRKNFGGFSSEAGARVAAIYLTFVETCKLMKKTALDFFKGFFGMTTSGRTDYELIVQELLC